MRTEKSIKNVSVAFISNFIIILIGFISQSIFAQNLGKEYLGLNGLFSNIVSMLGIVELGIGSALIYHLYKPTAENNIPQIKALMNFYKISYRYIALIILILGLIILPFINYFVDTSLSVNIYLIFILFIIETVVSYLLSYKRSILYAYQENYIVNIVHIIYIVLLNISQFIILIYTKNYYLYLVLKIIFKFIENLVITYVANKRYSFVKEKTSEKIDKDVKNDIIKKVKALFLHKIGSYLVLGTDNIIISKLIGLVTVGIYSNYCLIMNGIKNLFSQIYYSITASVGNLLVENNHKKAHDIYKKMLFMNYWLASFCSISFYVISKPFIEIWLGEDFILINNIIFFLMIQLYLEIFGYTIGSFKTAAGIFHEDRWVPIIQSIVNIIFSIILGKYFGLIGVVWGTILSYLLLHLYSYPVFVYAPLFKDKKRKYFKEIFKYFLLFLITFFITTVISNNIIITNSKLLNTIIAIITCIIVPNSITFIIFHKTQEFEYYKNIICKKLENLIKKVQRKK